MKERNPFFIKSYEGAESDKEYLKFFNSEALQPIDDDFLDSIRYVNSSPGAGKTSVFKAFSPRVIRLVMENNESYGKMYDYYLKRHIIFSNQIKLLTCYISCARNYDAIEDTFSNGRRKQVFFALLNTRIIIACLRAFCEIKSISIDDDLERITFENIPDEMLGQKEHFVNGRTLFDWACETESELCSILDDDEDEQLVISFMHTTLLCIKLFEPGCICLDKKQCVDRTLFIFDDFHKLSSSQKANLIEAFYVLRPKVGVWFGQRFIGLTTERVLLYDGRVGREYTEDRELNLENYWIKYDKVFYKMLADIANSRLNGINDISGNYEDLLENKPFPEEKFEQQICNGIVNLIEIVSRESQGMHRYDEIFARLYESKDKDWELAKRWQVLLMLIRRDQRGQLSLELEKMQQEEFERIYKDNQGVAEYYFSIDNDIPYYFGMNMLKKLASFNIEQFLTFAGSVFELNKAGRIISNNTLIRVSPKEQEELFSKMAQQRWDDIPQRFTSGTQIQNMIKNLCIQAGKERERESNSYTGGTFSGIGIEMDQLHRILDNDHYKELRKILGQCISEWYFEKRKITQNGKEWLVLYYNRWICLKFKLPFAYGGWKRISAEQLNACLLNHDISLDDEYEYTMFLIGE